MLVDYSPEDLKELLHVSSQVEYVKYVSDLYNCIKMMLSHCESENKDNNTQSDLIDEMKRTITKGEISLHEELKTFASHGTSCNTSLPELFNNVRDEKSFTDLCSENIMVCVLAYRLLNESYNALPNAKQEHNVSYNEFIAFSREWVEKLWSSTTTTDEADVSAVVEEVDATINEEVKPMVVENKEVVKEDVVKEDVVKEEVVKEDVVKEDVVKEDVVKTHDNIRLVIKDSYESIAVISNKMREKLDKFLTNYNKLQSEKQTVEECITQLRSFAAKGLQVESAMIPLNQQLENFDKLQQDYLLKLVKVNDDFETVMSDMTSARDKVILKL